MKIGFNEATAGLVTEYRNKYTGVAALLDRIDEIRKGGVRYGCIRKIRRITGKSSA